MAEWKNPFWLTRTHKHTLVFSESIAEYEIEKNETILSQIVTLALNSAHSELENCAV